MQTLWKTEDSLTQRQMKRAHRYEDLEMKECLARLKVWQTENLMAPHGMDRFADANNRSSGAE